MSSAWHGTTCMDCYYPYREYQTSSAFRQEINHQKQPSICKLYKGTWYLDPGNPQTDNYLASIVREIVSRYDIDGIHLDYIRYPEQAKDFPDQNTYRKYGKKNSCNNGEETI